MRVMGQSRYQGSASAGMGMYVRDPAPLAILGQFFSRRGTDDDILEERLGFALGHHTCFPKDQAPRQARQDRQE